MLDLVDHGLGALIDSKADGITIEQARQAATATILGKKVMTAKLVRLGSASQTLSLQQYVASHAHFQVVQGPLGLRVQWR